jgi:hypothetical protein
MIYQESDTLQLEVPTIFLQLLVRKLVGQYMVLVDLVASLVSYVDPCEDKYTIKN